MKICHSQRFWNTSCDLAELWIFIIVSHMEMFTVLSYMKGRGLQRSLREWSQIPQQDEDLIASQGRGEGVRSFSAPVEVVPVDKGC